MNKAKKVKPGMCRISGLTSTSGKPGRIRSMVLFCLLILLRPLYSDANVRASDDVKDKFRIIEFKGHSGFHLYSGGPLEEALESGYSALELRFGWQSSNPHGWQSMYNYPAYGIGWYSGFIGNPEQLGMPGGVYGFISFPLQNKPKHVFITETALGLSYDLNPFDPETNEHNHLIGSRFNVYFNLNIGGRYKFNREIDLMYGVDITHFSNGRMFRPNRGLNMMGVNLGLRYHFNASQKHIDNSTHPSILLDARPRHTVFNPAEKVNSGNILITAAVGGVQNNSDIGTRNLHLTSSIMLEYAYRFNPKHGTTTGFDLLYDKSRKEKFPDDKQHVYAAHLGYDYYFWKICMRLQLGTYLHSRGHRMKGSFFLRPALQYNTDGPLFLQLGLKTRAGFRADWIEYGVGVRL